MERRQNPKISGDGLQPARWTILGTLVCLAVSLAFNYLAFRNLDASSFQRGMLTAAIVPVVLAVPLFYYLSLKLRELAAVNHRLGIVSSTDSLTTCLNRGAFAAKVEANLINPSGRSRLPGGALLIVDADHFKRINDRFGDGEGDQALRLIANSIRGCIRGSDLLGRLGGQEFGVFLPGAAIENATDIAERIRNAVSEAEFVPGGWPHQLSVSVGGAVFTDPVPASELFRVANRSLDRAKLERRAVSLVTAVSPPRPVVAVKAAAAR